MADVLTARLSDLQRTILTLALACEQRPVAPAPDSEAEKILAAERGILFYHDVKVAYYGERKWGTEGNAQRAAVSRAVRRLAAARLVRIVTPEYERCWNWQNHVTHQTGTSWRMVPLGTGVRLTDKGAALARRLTNRTTHTQEDQ